MGQGSNLPGEYLDTLVTHRAEVALLLAAAIVGVLLWRWARATVPPPAEQRDARRPGSDAPGGPATSTAGTVSPAAGTPGGGKLRFPTFLCSGVGTTEPRSRKLLRNGIGLLWVLDGILQAQPDMPRQFVPMVIEPAFAGQPGWVAHLDRLGINLWTSHTVTTDAFTVFIQVAIGLAILLGGDGVIGRAGLSVSVGWGLSVWVLGEGMGGILARGATWLSGVPGGALFYVVTAVVLLAVPPATWKREERRIGAWITTAVGGLWLVLAVVQALPSEGLWTRGPLSQVFASAAGNPQPAVISGPITAMAHLALRDPVAVNASVVTVLVVLGIGMIAGRHRRGWLWANLVWLGVTWWLGMDFGILGGVGTDPNSAGPLALFVVAALVALAPADAAARSAAPVGTGGVPPDVPTLWRTALSLWLCTAAAIATAWTAVPVLGALPAAAATPTVETAALVQSGGLADIPGRPPAPSFHLVNQDDRQVSLSTWRGKVVLLSFLDPVCYETCPVVTEELAQVATLLAARRTDVEFVAIDANPDFRSPAALRSFDDEHGVAALPNWQFLTGSARQLRAAWAAYGAVTEVPQVGMVAHSLLVYLIGPNGREAALTQATGQPGPAIEASYAQMFADAAAGLLPHG